MRVPEGDAWIVEAETKIGCEISFTRHFHQPPKLRTLEEIATDIRAVTVCSLKSRVPIPMSRSSQPALLYPAFNMA